MRICLIALSVLCVTVISGCASVVVEESVVTETRPKLVLAAASKPLLTEQLVCPGAGIAECEANWHSVQVGDGAADVERWLGGGQSETNVYIDRVMTRHSFDNGGELIFRDGVLVELSLPESYAFPLSNKTV